jgi:antitoxin component YwqK of YwqJK toxin-antitoxin module
MKKLLILLFSLLISNYSLALDNEKLIKNYLNFQKNYLNEVISFEKNKSAPDSDEIEKFLFCQNNLSTFFSSLIDMDFESETDKELMLFLEPKKIKKLNKDLKSYFKILQSQDEEFNMFGVMMLIDENSDSAPEPFEKLSLDNFSLILGASFIYANGCEKDLKNQIDEVNKIVEDVNNNPSGSYTEVVSLHDNGQKDQESVYEYFEKVQDLFWYDTGEKRVALNYVYGVLDNGVFFHKNGLKNSEGKYKNSKKDGVWTSWDENGIKYLETTYVNGLKTKISSFSGNEVNIKNYYEDGQEKFRGKWIEGKKHGSLMWWHENGEISAIEQYKDGVLDGKAIQKYPNGQTKQYVEYINGKMNGVVQLRDVNGNLTINRIYKNDVCVSGNC